MKYIILTLVLFIAGIIYVSAQTPSVPSAINYVLTDGKIVKTTVEDVNYADLNKQLFEVGNSVLGQQKALNELQSRCDAQITDYNTTITKLTNTFKDLQAQQKAILDKLTPEEQATLPVATSTITVSP